MDDDLIRQKVDEKKERRAELRRIKDLNDIRKVLSIPEGRRVWWKLMAKAGAFRTPYTGETNSTMRNCGEQAIGFFMLSELMDANPQSFAQMQREFKAELKRQEEEEKE